MPRPPWLSRTVLVLGGVSLLTDAASEMIVPLLPAFLSSVLGAGPLALGWIEGAADAVSSLLKLVSGRWADRLGRNRPLVLAGYSLSSLARPLVALATSPWHVFGVRVVDRVGKGLRTSPRDAMLAAAAPPADRGAAFGFHRGMDHAGAVLGPLVASALLVLGIDDLRVIFASAAVPSLAAVIVLTAVREPPSPQTAPLERLDRALGRRLVRILLPFGLFALANASDVFLLMKAGGSGAPLATLPLLWVALHVVRSVSSVLGGQLADRLGRRGVIACGWLIFVAVYTGLAFAESPWLVATLFVTYGLHTGFVEGPERALIAELAPPGRSGSVFGWYHLTLGIAALAASVLFGALWERFGSTTAFLSSAGIALAALVTLMTSRR